MNATQITISRLKQLYCFDSIYARTCYFMLTVLSNNRSTDDLMYTPL